MKDILVHDDSSISKSVERKINAFRQKSHTFEDLDDQPDRIENRITYARQGIADDGALERILGTSDFLSINFLSRGMQASRAICRLKVRAAVGPDEWYGTGFLVAPNLLVTNHHLIQDENQAQLTVANFGFERDTNGLEQKGHNFSLNPSATTGLFYTNQELDITFVGVSARAIDGTPLTDFGYLPLIPRTGKAIEGEWVTIIQHPGGEPKKIAVRDSQVILPSYKDCEDCYLDKFIHYSTDTSPGSSGSAVLNDQWQVVAVHHKALAAFNEKGEPLAKDGKTIWKESMGDENRRWIANEGVRISAIYNLIQNERYSDPVAYKLLNYLRFGLSMSSVIPQSAAFSEADILLEADGRPKPISHFDNASGYDPDFLSRRIPLPKPSTTLKPQLAKVKDGGVELKYTHFSSVFNQD